MRSPFRLECRALRPAPDEVNAQIRHLMERPSSVERAEEYVRLLELWAQATAPLREWSTAA